MVLLMFISNCVVVLVVLTPFLILKDDNIGNGLTVHKARVDGLYEVFFKQYDSKSFSL